MAASRTEGYGEMEIHLSDDYVAVLDGDGPFLIWSRKSDREYYAGEADGDRVEAGRRELRYSRRGYHGVEEASKVQEAPRAAIERVKRFLDSDPDFHSVAGRI